MTKSFPIAARNVTETQAADGLPQIFGGHLSTATVGN
jgi:hypothetical protein